MTRNRARRPFDNDALRPPRPRSRSPMSAAVSYPARMVGSLLEMLVTKALYIMVFFGFLLFVSLVLNVLLRWLLLPPGPLTNQQALYFDYTQPQPTAVAHFLPQPDSALVLLKDGTVNQTYAGGSLGFMASRQAYRVFVRLRMPESPTNLQVGVFQVLVELLTPTGDVLDRASHPCVVKYPGSVYKRVLMSALRLPVLFFVGMDETQEVQLLLFARRLEHRGAPLAAVRVTLLPRNGKTVPPQIYEASAHVDLYLPLPLRILYTYQLPTYVLGVIILFCVLSSAAMGTAGLLYLLSPFISTRPQRAEAASPRTRTGASPPASPGAAVVATARAARGGGDLPHGWKKVHTAAAEGDDAGPTDAADDAQRQREGGDGRGFYSPPSRRSERSNSPRSRDSSALRQRKARPHSEIVAEQQASS